MGSVAVGAVLLVLAGGLLGGFVTFRALRLGMVVVIEDVRAELEARGLVAGFSLERSRAETDRLLEDARARTYARRGRRLPEDRPHA